MEVMSGLRCLYVSVTSSLEINKDALVKLKLSNIMGLRLLKSAAPTAMKPLLGTIAGMGFKWKTSCPSISPEAVEA